MISSTRRTRGLRAHRSAGAFVHPRVVVRERRRARSAPARARPRRRRIQRVLRLAHRVHAAFLDAELDLLCPLLATPPGS